MDRFLEDLERKTYNEITTGQVELADFIRVLLVGQYEQIIYPAGDIFGMLHFGRDGRIYVETSKLQNGLYSNVFSMRLSTVETDNGLELRYETHKANTSKDSWVVRDKLTGVHLVYVCDDERILAYLQENGFELLPYKGPSSLNLLKQLPRRLSFADKLKIAGFIHQVASKLPDNKKPLYLDFIAESLNVKMGFEGYEVPIYVPFVHAEKLSQLLPFPKDLLLVYGISAYGPYFRAYIKEQKIDMLDQPRAKKFLGNLLLYEGSKFPVDQPSELEKVRNFEKLLNI